MPAATVHLRLLGDLIEDRQRLDVLHGRRAELVDAVWSLEDAASISDLLALTVSALAAAPLAAAERALLPQLTAAGPLTLFSANRPSLSEIFLAAVERTGVLPYRGFEDAFQREIEFIFTYSGD